MEKQNFVYFLPLYTNPKEKHSFLILEYMNDDSVLCTRIDSTDSVYKLAEQVLKTSKRDIVLDTGGSFGRNFLLRLFPLAERYRDKIFLSSVFSIYAFDKNVPNKEEAAEIINYIHSPSSCGGMRHIDEYDRTAVDAWQVKEDDIESGLAIALYNHPLGVALRILTEQITHTESASMRNDLLDVRKTETLIVYISHGLLKIAQSPFVPILVENWESCSSVIFQDFSHSNNNNSVINVRRVITESMKAISDPDSKRSAKMRKLHANIVLLVDHINEFLDILENRNKSQMLPPVFHSLPPTDKESRTIYLLNFLTDVWKSLYASRDDGNREMCDTSHFSEHIREKLKEFLK